MKDRLTFVAVLALAVAALLYSLSPRFPVARGLDLQGGMRVTLQPDYSRIPGRKLEPGTMELVRGVLENRVNSFGLSGAEVRLKGEDQVLVLLPGARRPEEALQALSKVAQLEFRHLMNVQSSRNAGARYRMTLVPGNPEAQEPDRYQFTDTATHTSVPAATVLREAELILKGDALRPTSQAEIDPNRAQPVVSFEFRADGAREFGRFTTENVGETLGIVLDGELISAPSITEPITEGQGQISGGFRTMAEARLLANLLNSGALPIPLLPAETQAVGATLGQDSVNQSIRAGLAGLGIVLLFMLGFYWLPGLVACLALLVYAALTFAIFKGAGIFPPIVLDLPGITGFILSIGMAVDGNVLIFERMKEEMRAGKSLQSAIDAGFRRAFTAIVDSNVTVWIISAVLIWLGTPVVKGFAITLAIGNAVAMFTAITVTRSFLRVLTGMAWARNPALYGLHNSWLNLLFPGWRRGGVLRIWDRRRLYLGASGVLALVSVGFILLTPLGKGLKPGIDFTGGSALEVAFRGPNVTREEVVRVLQSRGIRDAQVRLGYSEQPWTRVRLEAAEMDAASTATLRDRLAEGEGLGSFDPDAYQPGKPGKGFRAEAVYTAPVTEAQVRRALRNDGNLKLTVTPEARTGERRVTLAEITTRQLPPAEIGAVKEALGKLGGGTIAPMTRVTSVGPSIAAEVTRNGIFSALVASLAMLLFLACRFAIGGFGKGLKFGAGAVVALFHDVLLTVGLFALMGHLAGWQVDSLFLTACLGLLGFSVNDTIVVYDRIRENLERRRKGESFAEVSDRSLTESFDRSVNTSVAVMLALAAMTLWGGETLRLFNLALLFGMAVGTYSSVFVATPLVVLLARGRAAEAGRDLPVPAASGATFAPEEGEPDLAIPGSRGNTTTVRPRRGRRM